MSSQCINLTPDLVRYISEHSVRESRELKLLREETRKMPRGGMQISPIQGQLFRLLVKLTRARKTLDVGVFTGYSSLVVAQALPDDGRVVALDMSKEFTDIALKFWNMAGVAHKISLKLAPALETLANLLKEGQEGTFDFAFIDADKTEYEECFERCLALVRPGGLIAVDNVLWGGSLLDDQERDPETNAIRAFNAARRNDSRIHLCMLPVGDGLTLAVKRE